MPKFNQALLILLSCLLLQLSMQVHAENINNESGAEGNQTRWCELEKHRLNALNEEISVRRTLLKNVEELNNGKPEHFISLGRLFNLDDQGPSQGESTASTLSGSESELISNTHCPQLKAAFIEAEGTLNEVNKALEQAALTFSRLTPLQKQHFKKIVQTGITIQNQEQAINALKVSLLDTDREIEETVKQTLAAQISHTQQTLGKLKEILQGLAMLNFQNPQAASKTIQGEMNTFFLLLWKDAFSLANPLEQTGAATPYSTDGQSEKDYSEALEVIRHHLWQILTDIKWGMIQARASWATEHFQFSSVFSEDSTALNIESQALYYVATYPLPALQQFFRSTQTTKTQKTAVVLLHIWDLLQIIGYAAILIWLSRSAKNQLQSSYRKLLANSEMTYLVRFASQCTSLVLPYSHLIILYLLMLIGRSLHWLETTRYFWLTDALLFLYILHGFCLYFAEITAIRIADSAHKYVSGSGLKEIVASSRTFAQKQTWLTALILCLAAIIGKGFFYSAGIILYITFTYLFINQLLAPQRSNIATHLQNLLVKFGRKEDNPVPAIWVRLFSPILMVPLTFIHVVSKTHHGLSFYSWYRQLFSHSLTLASEASEEETTTTEAPSNYEKWFSESLASEETPHIQTKLFSELSERLTHWVSSEQQGKVCIVSGEKGIGKTATFKKIFNQCKSGEIKSTVTYIDTPAKTTTLSALEELLKTHNVRTDVEQEVSEISIPRVIILDNAQHLFLTAVGHLEAFDSLLAIIRRTEGKVFWLIGITHLSWNYLRRARPESTCALDAIHAQTWSQSEIRSLILSRHHKSGFQLTYERIALSANNNDIDALRTAEQRFFYLLNDLCHGNPAVSLKLWLSSIEVVAGKRVIANTPKKPNIPEISAVPAGYLFVFAALLIHHTLNEKELVMVTNLSQSEVASALHFGMGKGLLCKKLDRYGYQLSHLHFINQYLQRKNMLHE